MTIPKCACPVRAARMEIAAWANRCYILTPHQKRRFPEKVDFRTSAGFLSGRSEREAAELRGGGPQAVVTDLGILEPDETGELVLTALHPGQDRGAGTRQHRLGAENRGPVLRETIAPSAGGAAHAARRTRSAGDLPQGGCVSQWFISPDERRLRSFWRVLVQAIFQAGSLVFLTIALAAIVLLTGWELFDESVLLLSQLGTFITSTLLIFAGRRLIDRRSIASLGLRLSGQAAADLLAGMIIGGLGIGLMFTLLRAAGWLQIQGFAWE